MTAPHTPFNGIWPALLTPLTETLDIDVAAFARHSRSLLDAGAVTPDPLGIGLAIDEGSRVSGAQRMWALGPLARARYWEIVAVPDIRDQAAAVADDIAQELGG